MIFLHSFQMHSQTKIRSAVSQVFGDMGFQYKCNEDHSVLQSMYQFLPAVLLQPALFPLIEQHCSQLYFPVFLLRHQAFRFPKPEPHRLHRPVTQNYYLPPPSVRQAQRFPHFRQIPSSVRCLSVHSQPRTQHLSEYFLRSYISAESQPSVLK